MDVVVARVLGLVTVQDLGRTGHMHEAVPPGGALAPELLVAANRAARNADDAPALEVMGTLVVRAERDVELASDREAACVLHAGDEQAFASEPARVTYVAIRGGMAAPLVLGGRGTLLVARLGRVLRAGDRLASANEPETRSLPPPVLARAPFRLLPGPDRDAFAADALDVLVASTYRIAATSDRVGTRLEGPAVPRLPGARERSRPMVRGAIEVPGDGGPIVLGPEHPTTGGYPVVAVVASGELGGLFAVRLGGSVNFRR